MSFSAQKLKKSTPLPGFARQKLKKAPITDFSNLVRTPNRPPKYPQIAPLRPPRGGLGGQIGGFGGLFGPIDSIEKHGNNPGGAPQTPLPGVAGHPQRGRSNVNSREIL